MRYEAQSLPGAAGKTATVPREAALVQWLDAFFASRRLRGKTVHMGCFFAKVDTATRTSGKLSERLTGGLPRQCYLSTCPATAGPRNASDAVRRARCPLQLYEHRAIQ